MKVLVIEHDPQAIKAIQTAFKVRWNETKLLLTSRGYEGIDMVEKECPDIVILSLNLPDMNGMEVIREIRSFSDVPLILLVEDSEPEVVIKGLEMGADDCIAKPFAPLVLLARAKSVLRRVQMPELWDDEKPLVWNGLVIDFASRELTGQGEPVKLTPLEWDLLYYLARNSGRIVPYRVLWEKVWGGDYIGDITTIKTAISRLRAKLGDNNGLPLIINHRGKGYFIRKLK